MSERVSVEVRGLETFGPHGVTAAEREAGCRIVLDITLAVEAGATASDDIAETVDYGAVARLATDLVAARSFHTLEALSAAIRAAKPEPPMSLELTDVAVTLRRGW